jgi:hypothetical protein
MVDLWLLLRTTTRRSLGEILLAFAVRMSRRPADRLALEQTPLLQRSQTWRRS